MSRRSRYVIDTNVLVSAVLFEDSIPGQSLAIARQTGRLLVSAATIEELAEVLARPKLDHHVTPQVRERFLQALIVESVVAEVVEAIYECRDPNDNKFLEVALAGSADCIITGDNDLLALHAFRQIPILSPAEFVQRFAAP